MKKSIVSFVITIMIILNPVLVHALEYPELDSKIVEVYDLKDKKIIYKNNINKEVSIASLTKIVTTITAIENISNLDEEVVINDEILSTVRWDASKAGLKVGDKVSYRDLLYGSMLPSGADATNAIAILSSGSIDNFVVKMNDLVSKLGLKNTHFVNVTGLDAENHYSSADDVRKLLEYALDNELFKQIYTTQQYTLKNGLTVYSTLRKYNNMGINTSNILGSKTGYTGEAGYCLSSLSNINSHEFLIIVLKAKHKDEKYYSVVDTVTLIDFLLDNYKYQVLVKKDDVVKTIPIRLSKEDNYKVHASKDIKKYLPSDYDKNKFKIKYEGKDHLSFINKKGKKIGTVSYYYDNKLISKEDVVLNTKIHMSIKKILKEYFYVFILIILIIFYILIKPKKKRKKKTRII